MKDAKGHGSESRGGGTEAQKDARTVQGIRNWLGVKPGGPKGGPGGGQPVVSNAHAAATLAGGPKSAPVDVHPAMAERPNAWGQYPKQAAEARAQLRSDRKQ